MRVELSSLDKGIGKLKLLECVVPLVQFFMAMCLTSEGKKKGKDEEKERGMITLGK